jgi:hypothetical protein
MEAITPASIRGGFRGGNRLLERINGKLVITKDFATILTTRREARNELFGLLRNVRDGRLTADFGTHDGHIEQQCRFDWLIGTTPVFSQFRVMEDLLGARYVDLNWHTGNREEMAFRAAINSPRMPEIREVIAISVCQLSDRAKLRQEHLPASLSTDEIRLISDWADLTARLRTPVARDRQHRIQYTPQPEVGTDLAQVFTKIAKGLRLLREEDFRPYIARLAHDSIPHSRRDLVAHLLRANVERGGVIVSSSALSYDMGDLEALGVVRDNRIIPELRGRIEALVRYW